MAYSCLAPTSCKDLLGGFFYLDFWIWTVGLSFSCLWFWLSCLFSCVSFLCHHIEFIVVSCFILKVFFLSLSCIYFSSLCSFPSTVIVCPTLIIFTCVFFVSSSCSLVCFPFFLMYFVSCVLDSGFRISAFALRTLSELFRLLPWLFPALTTYEHLSLLNLLCLRRLHLGPNCFKWGKK